MVRHASDIHTAVNPFFTSELTWWEVVRVLDQFISARFRDYISLGAPAHAEVRHAPYPTDKEQQSASHAQNDVQNTPTTIRVAFFKVRFEEVLEIYLYYHRNYQKIANSLSSRTLRRCSPASVRCRRRGRSSCSGKRLS